MTHNYTDTFRVQGAPDPPRHCETDMREGAYYSDQRNGTSGRYYICNCGTTADRDDFGRSISWTVPDDSPGLNEGLSQSVLLDAQEP